MIGQEPQIILVKLELQRMLLQNLQRYGKMDKDSQGEEGAAGEGQELVRQLHCFLLA